MPAAPLCLSLQSFLEYWAQEFQEYILQCHCYILGFLSIFLFLYFLCGVQKIWRCPVYGRQSSDAVKRRYGFFETNMIAYFSLHLVCCCLDSQIFSAFFYSRFFLFLLLRFFNLLFLWLLLDFFFFNFFYFQVWLFLLRLYFAAFSICFVC